MSSQDYVTLKEISEQFGLDRSNTRKWLLNQGFDFAKIRDNESRQAVNALSVEDAERATQIRLQQGFTPRRAQSVSPIIDNGMGVLYVIRLMPDVAPNRIKIGFAGSLQSRIDAHRCTCPRLELVKSWPCRKTHEAAAIAIAINDSAVLYGGEVYDVESVDKVVERLDAFFAMLETKKPTGSIPMSVFARL